MLKAVVTGNWTMYDYHKATRLRLEAEYRRRYGSPS